MDNSFIIENRKERERLQNLVNRLTDKKLSLILYKEGWTVAVALAHLAFWDQRRLELIKKWKNTGVEPSPVDMDTINNALIPFFLAIPPRKAAELAVSIAEEVDRELEALPTVLIEAIQNSKDAHALNRYLHRQMHLDDIEKLLKLGNT
jgi:hypothetical protein